MVSAVDLAKRAFIKVLLQLAVTNAVKLSLSRDSPDDAVNAAYRKVSLKVHPDKGGTDDQQRSLNAQIWINVAFWRGSYLRGVISKNLGYTRCPPAGPPGPS